tara:strand:+ start:323 stop:472 length:150 start_codon:yes stop_codon:yes gene_type:complete
MQLIIVALAHLFLRLYGQGGYRHQHIISLGIVVFHWVREGQSDKKLKQT